MALTQNDKLAFRMMYHVAMASRMAEKPGPNSWGDIGKVVSRAESFACLGGHSTPALPGECKKLSDWMDNHRGNRKKIIVLSDIESLRSTLANMTGDPRNKNLRHAGLWLGYAFGTCGLSLVDHQDRAEELRRDIRSVRDFLEKVDSGMAGWISPLQAEAARPKPDYRKAQSLIEQVFTRF